MHFSICFSPFKTTVIIENSGFFILLKESLFPPSPNLLNLLSKSLQFSTNGQTGFDGDFYVRECLKEMIVDAPWGRTTETFLISIDHRLGTVLEELVPKAFDAAEDTDGDLENLKDEQ